MTDVKMMKKAHMDTELPSVDDAELYIHNTALEMATELKQAATMEARNENTLDANYDNIPRPSPRM